MNRSVLLLCVGSLALLSACSKQESTSPAGSASSARRYVDGTASCDGSVDVAGNDYHHAALGRLDTAEPERLHELDATAGGLEHAAEISAVS
jgi:hypothetical protein